MIISIISVAEVIVIIVKVDMGRVSGFEFLSLSSGELEFSVFFLLFFRCFLIICGACF